MARGGMNRTMIKQLIESANPSQLAKHSFHNYHTRGLDYLCLHRNSRMTVKVYFFRKGISKKNADGWIVWPHTHRFAFEHWQLKGKVTNHIFTIEKAGEQPFEIFGYNSELHSTHKLGECGLFERSSESGDFAMLDPTEIHTLTTDGEAMALQIQYHDVHDGMTLMMAPRGARVDCRDGNLYSNPNEYVVRDWLNEVAAVL